MSSNQFFQGFKKGTGKFGNLISTIVNSVLLSIVYIIGVGITSIIAGFIGKRFLDTKTSEKSYTYWTDLELKKSKEDYYKQF